MSSLSRRCRHAPRTGERSTELMLSLNLPAIQSDNITQKLECTLLVVGSHHTQTWINYTHSVNTNKHELRQCNFDETNFKMIKH
jgi:hypothetical protein